MSSLPDNTRSDDLQVSGIEMPGFCKSFPNLFDENGGRGVSTGHARNRKKTVKGAEYTLNLLQIYFDHAVLHWRNMANRYEILLHGDCKLTA